VASAGRLRFDPGERAFGFCFDGADGLAIDVEQIVREAEARLHLELARGDATPGREVKVVAALDEPACRRQVGIDFSAGLLFGRLWHPGRYCCSRAARCESSSTCA
jgi:hypothetical protein